MTIETSTPGPAELHAADRVNLSGLRKSAGEQQAVLGEFGDEALGGPSAGGKVGP